MKCKYPEEGCPNMEVTGVKRGLCLLKNPLKCSFPNPNKLPPDIEGIREMTARYLWRLTHLGVWDELNLDVREAWLREAVSFLSKLTELGARIKINGKWYSLDGTAKEG